MVSQEVVIKNRAGVHARPAAMLVQKASEFKSDIFIQKDDEKINAKSIMGILALGAGFKSSLLIIADGEDEKEALAALVLLVENRFEEEQT